MQRGSSTSQSGWAAESAAAIGGRASRRSRTTTTTCAQHSRGSSRPDRLTEAARVGDRAVAVLAAARLPGGGPCPGRRDPRRWTTHGMSSPRTSGSPLLTAAGGIAYWQGDLPTVARPLPRCAGHRSGVRQSRLARGGALQLRLRAGPRHRAQQLVRDPRGEVRADRPGGRRHVPRARRHGGRVASAVGPGRLPAVRQALRRERRGPRGGARALPPSRRSLRGGVDGSLAGAGAPQARGPGTRGGGLRSFACACMSRRATSRGRHRSRGRRRCRVRSPAISRRRTGWLRPATRSPTRTGTGLASASAPQ